VVKIRKERKIQITLFSKLLLCGRWIRADPNYSHFQLIEMLPASLRLTAWTVQPEVPAWIEEEKDLASTKI